MKPKKRLTISALILITSLVLSPLCSASITASIDTGQTSYGRTDNVAFTAEVIIIDEIGCCNLDSATLHISDGSSQTCKLATEQGNYDSGYGNCNLKMIVSETHPTDCDTHGGSNTYSYTINWIIPPNLSAGHYTATISVESCEENSHNQADFDVTTTTFTPDAPHTIQLGVTELMIILLALILIATVLMIQVGKI